LLQLGRVKLETLAATYREQMDGHRIKP
jgi:hypothetical protein